MTVSKVLAQTEGLDSLAAACALAAQGGGAVVLPFVKPPVKKAKAVSKPVAAPLPPKYTSTHKLLHREKPKTTFDAAVEFLYHPKRKLKKLQRLTALRSILRLVGSGMLPPAYQETAAQVLDDAYRAGDIDAHMKKEVEAAYAAIPTPKVRKA